MNRFVTGFQRLQYCNNYCLFTPLYLQTAQNLFNEIDPSIAQTAPLIIQAAFWTMALVLSAVLLGCRLDGTASLGQIPWDHHWMNLNACVQRKEPWLYNRWDLGGILHFEENKPRPLTIGVQEISGFRLQILQNGLDGRTKLSGLRQSVPCFDIHDHFEKKSHRPPPDISHSSNVKLDSFKPSKVLHVIWGVG
jgi:hypothetical protein